MAPCPSNISPSQSATCGEFSTVSTGRPGYMEAYTLSFDEVDGTRLTDVGGKGANLGEMTRAGFPVPPGFCVTTAAYRDFVRTSAELDALLDELAEVSHEDLGRIGALGRRIREHLE